MGVTLLMLPSLTWDIAMELLIEELEFSRLWTEPGVADVGVSAPLAKSCTLLVLIGVLLAVGCSESLAFFTFFLVRAHFFSLILAGVLAGVVLVDRQPCIKCRV